jgi:hypothetical protein
MASEHHERQEKIERILQRMRERLEQDWPQGETDATGVEEIVGRLEREVLREITEEMLQEQSRRRQGNQSACPHADCGGVARYRKDSTLEVVTLFGRIQVARPYFYCSRCGHGHCPLDARWGLGPGHTTPGVQELITAVAAFEAYQYVPLLLPRVRAQVHLGVKTIELIAQRLGKAVEQDPPPGYGPAERPLAVAADGVIMPLRGGGKEARCGVLYEPDWGCARTPSACAALRKEYFATLESRDTLMARLCARARARRPHPEAQIAALGDGAEWIWEGFAKYLPGRVEILDFYHVAERLGAIAKAMFSDSAAGKRAGQQWREAQEQELLAWGPRKLLEALEVWEPQSAAAEKVQEDQLRYFRNQRHRMHYPEYLRQGFPIGSGAVEGACKHVVSDRFRGTGMRWKSKTAEPLLQARAGLLTRPDLDLRTYAMTC